MPSTKVKQGIKKKASNWWFPVRPSSSMPRILSPSGGVLAPPLHWNAPVSEAAADRTRCSDRCVHSPISLSCLFRVTDCLWPGWAFISTHSLSTVPATLLTVTWDVWSTSLSLRGPQCLFLPASFPGAQPCRGPGGQEGGPGGQGGGLGAGGLHAWHVAVLGEGWGRGYFVACHGPVAHTRTGTLAQGWRTAGRRVLLAGH